MEINSNKQQFRGNGLLGRFLFCIPDGRVGKRNVRERSVIPDAVQARYNQGIIALLNIEVSMDAPVILTLSDDAREAFYCFSEFVEELLASELQGIRDWGGKLPGKVLKIAGLLHVAEHGIAITVIALQTVENACDLCELLIPHAQAAFGYISSDPETKHAKRIFKWLMDRANPLEAFTKHDCHRALHGSFQKVEYLDKPLKELVSRNIISGPHKQSRANGGRPSEVYHVNPQVITEAT